VTFVKGLEHRYTYFSEGSEVYLLNHRQSNTHILSDELSGLIGMALFYTQMTHGAFDIALAGTLKAASKAPSHTEYRNQKELLLPFAGSEHLRLDGNRCGGVEYRLVNPDLAVPSHIEVLYTVCTQD